MKKNIALLLGLLFFCFLPYYLLVSTELGEKKGSVDNAPWISLIEGQLEAIRNQDFEKAYNEFTSASFKKATSFEQFIKFIGSTPAIQWNHSFRFYSQYVENGIASFQGSLNAQDGTSLQVEYDLVEEKGKWKIWGIQVFKQDSYTPKKELGIE